MIDIHIADKESPAQPIYVGWSVQWGYPALGGSAYSPILLSTTHVLDAAVRTVNALHKKTPLDYGIFLGDDINNSVQRTSMVYRYSGRKGNHAQLRRSCGSGHY
jgi:hypothetical protein